MADVRESFTTLEGASQEGLALRAVQEGQTVAAKNGSIAIAFQDSANNAALPELTAAGAVVVDGSAVTQPVSAASLPLPTGASTSALQTTGNASLASIDAKLTNPLPVSFAAVVGDGRKARGTVGGSLTLVTVATLALVVSKTYENLDFNVSCFRDARFQVILNDNGAETIVADAICGPGQFSFHGQLSEGEFATGASGTQSIIIKALNLNALSDFYASVSVKIAN